MTTTLAFVGLIYGIYSLSSLTFGPGMRKYVEKDKRALKPTALGLSVNEFLVIHLNELFDVHFTAGMEELLDKIEAECAGPEKPPAQRRR